MELKINVFRLTAFAILIITIIIGIFILRHQNNAIRQLNDVIKQEQIDDSLQQISDSIKFKQLQLRVYSDSMATAKMYRDRELELVKRLTKNKIKKHENIITILPNANDATRDSIWKSELTKPEGRIK
jgi:hypothetical protein